MAIPDEGSGGSYGTHEYDSFGGKVNVEVTDMVTYFQEMSALSAQIATSAGTAMGEMSMMISTGLSQGTGDVQPFPEGMMVARSMSGRLAQAQMFVRDLQEGVRNIGSGAVVVAELYENADSENGATVNDIGFVFGDPSARGPEGFRGGDVKTFNDMAEETGQNAMALTSDDSLARGMSYPYGTIYTFPDGSTKHVTWSTESGAGNRSDTSITTTTVRDADGNIISTVSEQTYNTHTTNYTTTTTVTGDDRNNRTSTTTTAEAPDGDMTVTNTTSNTTEGRQGPETTNTTTVERGEHREDTERGPVEQAADDMETHGTDDFVEFYGEGY